MENENNNLRKEIYNEKYALVSDLDIISEDEARTISATAYCNALLPGGIID